LGVRVPNDGAQSGGTRVKLAAAAALLTAAIAAGCAAQGFASPAAQPTPQLIYVTPAPTARPTPTATGTPEPTVEPTDTPEPTDTLEPAAKDARASIFVTGNVSPKLPAGTSGVVALVARAAKLDSSNVLAIVVRNNTSEAVERITASATIENSSGTLIGSGSDQGLNPNHVEPGEIAFGYIYFGDLAKLPSGAKVDIQLGSTPATDNTFENIRDLKGIRASRVQGSYGLNIVGQLINQYADPVGGPIGVDAACFDTAGHILYTDRDFAAPDTLSPNQKAAYTINLSGTCPVYLVAGSGFAP
jgi:hypothetical protein